MELAGRLGGGGSVDNLPCWTAGRLSGGTVTGSQCRRSGWVCVATGSVCTLPP